jgi:hypothetical protein
MRWPRRRGAAWIVVLAAVLIVVGVLVWFQPHKLLVDQRVDEALPAAVPAGGTEAGGTEAPAATPEPAMLAAGEFRSLGHATSGRAVVLELGDGMRLLRLKDLRTGNGPDLFAYLSATLAEGPRQAFDGGVVSLGRLKANQGNQNYRIPAGVDLRRLRNVVIWWSSLPGLAIRRTSRPTVTIGVLPSTGARPRWPQAAARGILLPVAAQMASASAVPRAERTCCDPDDKCFQQAVAQSRLWTAAELPFVTLWGRWPRPLAQERPPRLRLTGSVGSRVQLKLGGGAPRGPGSTGQVPVWLDGGVGGSGSLSSR